VRSSALLVAPLLALCVVEDRPHAEPESRRDGRITVIVGESGESGPSPRLIVMDADGKNAHVRLGYVIHASLSPNGRSIAYNGLGVRDARVIAADGRPRDRLLVRNGQGVDWSPKGDAVAFARYHHGLCCSDSDVWIENLNSRTQRRVVRNARSPDWSPDGRKLAFVRGPSASTNSSASDIWTIDLRSKRARRLIRHAIDPRWSPRGDRIAFVRFSQSDSFVYIARADGTEVRRVAEADSAAWSPNGSELAIADFLRVIRIRLDGRMPRLSRPRLGALGNYSDRTPLSCRKVEAAGIEPAFSGRGARNSSGTGFRRS
jgi:Tol biopolymer transport system component